ncbi:LOW QUALITY PROTEIN: hypothetical protein V1477_006689 [Vespula maculifrons]|uniref:Uncharacterized protein n=1 Tax=Vespula maculifrons TaxID=7453 RepID=A0ABD2CJK3_VESMC
MGKGSSRPTRPYFFYQDRTNRSRVITEPSYNGLNGTKEKEIFSLTIFFSETIAPRKTGLGSLERALRALHAHIFFIKIGPIGAESRVITKHRTGVIGKGSSRPTRPYFFYQDRTNRSRVITEPNYNGLNGTKEKEIFSLTIFFSETIAPRKTGLGSLERALRALHAHIFFIKIGPIGAERRVITEPSYNGLKGTKEKEIFSLTIFFSETIAPRKTGLGTLERALRALHAHIFFIKIGPIGADTLKNRTAVTGKRSSHTTRPYFFYQDRTNRSRVITGTKENEIFSLTIFFSETIAPRKTGLGSLERALRALHAHIFFIKIGPIGAESRVITKHRTGVIGKGSSRPTRPYFFYQDRTNRSRVITKHLTGVIGKGSSRPTRPYFFYQDRTNRSRVITHLEKPDWGRWKGLFAPYTLIFFLSRSDQYEPSYNALKGTKENEIFPLTIFFSETIAPRKTGLGSLERALRALHAHIFFIKIGPIGAESRVITEQSYNGLKGTKEKEIFPLTIFFSETIAPRKTGLGSLERALRALHAHIFFIKIGPIGADFKKNRAGHLEKPYWGHWKGLFAPYTPIFFYQDRTNRSRVITEQSYNGLKGTKEKEIFPLTIFFSETIAPRKTGLGYNGLKGTKEKEIFSLTIFFSETIAPRKAGLGSLERALCAVHAHIFFIKIGPIGADTSKNRTGVIRKGSSRPTRQYFFYQDPTYRSRVITEPSYNGLKGTKEKEIFSLTIFFSETIAPRKAGLGSLERALCAVHAHIFFIKIGPIGADTSKNRTGHLEKPDWGHSKGLFAPYTPIFFYQDRTNRSRVITYLEKPDWGHWKGLVAPSTPTFFSSRSDQRSRVITHLEKPDWGHWKGLFAPYTPIFFYQDRTNRSRVITEPSYNGLKGTKEKEIFSLTIFFSETIAPRKAGLGSLERALCAVHAHIFFIKIGPIGAESDLQEPSYNGLKGTKEKEIYSLTIFFSETIAPRKTGLGSLERALRALHAHIFLIKIRPIGAELLRSRVITEPSYNGLKGTKEKEIFSLTIFFSETIAPRKAGLGSLERALCAVHAHIFFIKIGPIGADTSKNRTGHLEKPDWGHSKGLFAPYTPIFFYQDRTNRSRVITYLEKPDWGHWKGLVAPSTPTFFSSRSDQRSRVITHLEKPDWGHWKGLFAPYTPIFFYQDRTNRSRVITEPSYNGLKGTKEKEIFSLTIFFSETIAPRKTGLGSLERALRALHAHIFFIKIRPIGAEL